MRHLFHTSFLFALMLSIGQIEVGKSINFKMLISYFKN